MTTRRSNSTSYEHLLKTLFDSAQEGTEELLKVASNVEASFQKAIARKKGESAAAHRQRMLVERERAMKTMRTLTKRVQATERSFERIRDESQASFDALEAKLAPFRRTAGQTPRTRQPASSGNTARTRRPRASQVRK